MIKRQIPALALSLCVLTVLVFPAGAAETPEVPETVLKTERVSAASGNDSPPPAEAWRMVSSPEEYPALPAEEIPPAAADSVSDGLAFSFSNAGELTVSGTGPLDLSGWTGNPVDVRSLVIRSGITSIPDRAFRDFSNLASADIAGSVETIGDYAFSACEKLSQVTIRPGVRSIGANAFYRCIALADVYLPPSLQTLGESAFYSCRSMASANIPAGVTALPDRVFAGCSGLTSISVPDSVKAIGEAAFSRCSGLTAITLPDSVETIGRAAFSDSSALEEVRLPDGLKRIEAETFFKCESLASIEFPSGLEFIGEQAFRGSGLTSVTVPGGLAVEAQAFYDCTKLKTAVLDGLPASLGEYVFSGCSSLTAVSLPEGLAAIPTGSFRYCQSLNSVNIPASVTEVRLSAFEGCYKLADLRLPASLKTIGDNAFQDCSMTGLDLPEGLSTIGDRAFMSCSYLEAVDLPEALASLGTGAFSRCLRLTWASLPAGIGEGVPEGLFSGCSSLTAVSLPGTVQRVAPNAFQECKNLRTVLFGGAQEEWDHYVTIDPQNNDALSRAAIYCAGSHPTLYTVTVTGSEATATGAGRYPAGTEVTLAIRNPFMATSQTFDHWEIEGVNPPDPGVEAITFTMPAGDVRAEVKWRVTLYTVEVSGSYSNASGQGAFPLGRTVTIRAGTRPGYTFDGWTIEGVELPADRLASPDVTFSMPANDISATARWRPLPLSVFRKSALVLGTSNAGALPDGAVVFAAAREGGRLTGVVQGAYRASAAQITFTAPPSGRRTLFFLDPGTFRPLMAPIVLE